MKKPVVKNNIPVAEALLLTEDVNEFVMMISDTISNAVYCNPLATEWRNLYVVPLNVKGKIFSLDVLHFETKLLSEMHRNHPQVDITNMSVEDMSNVVNGVEWTEAYAAYMKHSSIEVYIAHRWMTLRNEAGLPDMSHKFIGGYTPEEKSDGNN